MKPDEQPSQRRQHRLALKPIWSRPMKLDQTGIEDRNRYRLKAPKALPRLGWYDRLRQWWQKRQRW